MNRRISVRAIVLHEDKLLCVKQRHEDPHTKSTNKYWNLIGGGLEDNESILECLSREMIEETGIRAVVGNLMYVQQFSRNDVEYLEFFFHVTNSVDYLNVDLKSSTHGEEEIAEIDFIDPATSEILPTFLKTEPLSESINLPTKIFSTL